MTNLDPSNLFATACFAAAILHTFSAGFFRQFAHRFPAGSARENVFHLLGEVEVVFGIWAGAYLLFVLARSGAPEAIRQLEACDFTEPAFVFVILAVCATRPVLDACSLLIETASRPLPLPRPLAFYVTCLILGPILGSFITEPAAMTVTALILLDRFYSAGISPRLKYATLGLLFVNISIGGTLTPYAAPPILMVAKPWGWDLSFMLAQFGGKAALAIVISTGVVAAWFRRDLTSLAWARPKSSRPRCPVWLTLLHLAFLAAVVMTSHYLTVFTGLFLFFLGLCSVTREHQDELKLREGLLVAFFLGGLIVLGGPQRWWLEPLLRQLSSGALFLGGISLTAITDNAAITYLGAQVPSLDAAARYALVAGAVTGGGLTVIANAPNPAGYGILSPAFGESGIAPFRLFLSALFPTAVAALCFWFL